MSQSPSPRQIDEFEHRLDRFYRENCTMLARRFSSMAETSEIVSAIHQVLAEIFDRYVHGQPAPDNLGGFVHTAVQRKLIDLIRREVEKVPLDESDLDSPAGATLLDQPLTSQEDETGWKELFRILFARLPPKQRKVVQMLMQGMPQAEIGRRLGGQSGSSACGYARKRVCAILRELVAAGDELAGRLAHDFCRGSRREA